MVVMYSTDMSVPAKAQAVGVLTGMLNLHISLLTLGNNLNMMIIEHALSPSTQAR